MKVGLFIGLLVLLVMSSNFLSALEPFAMEHIVTWQVKDKQEDLVTFSVGDIGSLFDVKALWLNAFKERYKGRITTAELETDLAYGGKAIEQGLADTTSTLVTAKKEGQLVGFAFFKPVSSDTVELFIVAVEPSLQRLGIGAELVFSIFKAAPAVNRVVLSSFKPNVEAHAFYKKLGFQELKDEALMKALSEMPERSYWFEYYRR